jgi:hypothetical protein
VDGSGSTQAFLVAENNGRWGKAREVLGTAALNGGRYAALDSDTLADAPGRQAARVRYIGTAECLPVGFLYDEIADLRLWLPDEMPRRLRRRSSDRRA